MAQTVVIKCCLSQLLSPPYQAQFGPCHTVWVYHASCQVPCGDRQNALHGCHVSRVFSHMSTKHGHPRTHIHTMHKNTDTYKQTSSLQPPFRHLINEWKALARPRYTCRNVAPNHMAPRNQLTHPLIASDKAGLGGTTKCDVIVKQRSWRSTGGWVGECGASLQCNLWHSHLLSTSSLPPRAVPSFLLHTLMNPPRTHPLA